MDILCLDGGARKDMFRPCLNKSVSSVGPQTFNYTIVEVLIDLVFARATLAAAKLLIEPQIGIIKSPQLSKKISHDAWPVFAALTWASMMWLFRWHPDTVQSGLRSSMDYIYVQSDTWDSLRNFFIYNK